MRRSTLTNTRVLLPKAYSRANSNSADGSSPNASQRSRSPTCRGVSWSAISRQLVVVMVAAFPTGADSRLFVHNRNLLAERCPPGPDVVDGDVLISDRHAAK